MTSGSAWTALIPVKRLSLAKTRLRDPQRAELDQPPSSEFALAFARDVITATLDSTSAHSVFVVGTDADVLDASMSAAEFVSEDSESTVGGLNGALLTGIAAVRGREPRANIIVLTGDLAAIRSASIDALTGAAPPTEPSFIADHEGFGTATLLIPGGVDVVPQFGLQSAAAHARIGCTDLTSAAAPDIRLDIDTTSDLHAAIDLGVGPYTAAALTRLAMSTSG